MGAQWLADALIGAGVALVFGQLLFSPQPLVRTSSEYDRRGAASHAAGLMQDTRITTVAVHLGA